VPFVPFRGEEYDARFARLASEGQYLHGEADFVEWLTGGVRGRVLDAGCGTGRVAIELHRRGFDVVGVDVSPDMLDTARSKAPDQTWVVGDLSSGDLPASHFDVVLAAGNLMIFLEPGSEGAVVANLARCLVPGGALVAGFQLGCQLTLERYDALATAAGLRLDQRFSTWERAVYDRGDYAVSVHRRPIQP
jgi:ubiquinone/menaquinone biosynthesis C-methylase UbiE